MRDIIIRAAWLLSAALMAHTAQAQIVTDGSLGARVNLGGDVAIIGGDLGRRSGENLFHSFDRFSVGSGARATFGLPDGVGRVISRVTGAEASALNGLISFADDASVSLPVAADFWFFNPNGVFVGPDAQFRTSGALYFSGGDSVIFSDGATFSADTSQPLTITSARPEAFGFLNAAPGPVVIQGTELPAQGDGITLSGGEVTIDGAILRSDQAAETLTLIAGGEGDIAPVQPGERLVLTSGKIRISGALEGDVRTGSLETLNGGAVRLYAGEVEIDGGRALSIASRAAGGDVDVRADRLILRNGGDIGTLTVGVSPVGAPVGDNRDAGAIRVTARDITLTNGGAIRSQTQSRISNPMERAGDAGRITVDGFDRLLITRAGGDVETAIESEVAARADGNAGLVLVTGGDLQLNDGGSIFSLTFGDGDAGAVEVDVATLTVTDGSQIGSGARDNPEEVAIGLAATPAFDARATGRGGSVTVRASEAMSFSGKLRPRPTDPADAELESAGILTATEGEIAGRGGDIFASAPLIILSNEAEIGAETFSDADAGGITLEGGMLIVRDGSEISTTSRTTGDAGNVTLRFTDSIDLPSDGSIASSAQTELPQDSSEAFDGTAGRVLIQTGALTVGPDSQVATTSLSADGGAIIVDASRFAFVNDGNVTTSVASSDGAGGSIDFSGGPLALGAAARIESTADAGDGGTVTISSAITFLETPDAAIDVSSALGQDGTIQFLGAVGDQTAETEAPPAEFFNRFALIDDFCVAAVTGGSALRLVAPEAPPLSAGLAPALFGGAIPYPSTEGRAEALTLTLASVGGGCEAVQ